MSNLWWEEKEVWIGVIGYDQIYEVSNFGRVRRVGRAQGTQPLRVLKYKWEMRASRQGPRYPRVNLSVKGKAQDCLVHRLVLKAFIGEPPWGYEADHINGDTKDPRLINLRWLPRRENRAQGNQRRNKGDKTHE